MDAPVDEADEQVSSSKVICLRARTPRQSWGAMPVKVPIRAKVTAGRTRWSW